MHTTSRYLVFPDGDLQETEIDPPFDRLLDTNGFPLPLPLKTHKALVYRVFKVTKRENKGEDEILYFLEQVSAQELLSWVRT